MKLKIIDKYLVKQFLKTIVFALIAFTLIFVIIDLMEHLDDFIDHNANISIVLNYYLVFIPEIMQLMLPVAVLLAGLFVTGKLTNLNELTAIKSSGISLYRYLAPFVATSFVISIFAIYFGGYVVPKANRQKVYLERTYLGKNSISAGNNIYFQDTKNRIVTIGYFNVRRQEASNVSIQEFSPKDPTVMTSRIDASQMSYDSTKHAWILSRGTKRIFTPKEEKFETFDKLTVKDLHFTPEEVLKKQRKPEELNLEQLQEYASDMRRTGNDPTRILIEYHSRIAFAFASIIVVLFGVPVSANKRTGGLAIQFGISLLVTFFYLVFIKISQAFGKNGALSPVLTAWSANLVFLIAAIINLLRVRK
jgi:lipopolysaccharide export system permease protein